MKVLLVYSNVTNQAWVPIGLLYIAANLRKNDIDVKIADTRFDNIRQTILDYLPDYIGLGGMTLMANDALLQARMIKAEFPWIKIVFGGVHFTFLPNEAKQYADVIIRGEAEKVFVDIVKNDVLNKLYYKKLPGVLLKKNGVWLDYGEYELINDLDSLPIPAYDLIDMKRYSDELVTGEKAISILTGRGCPYNCSFCASPKLWRRKVRYHSIDYTINHIKYLIDNYNLKNLRIMDDTFTCSNARILSFCVAIEQNNV